MKPRKKIWSKAELTRLAKKYKNKNEFKKKRRSAYEAALSHPDKDKICAHMNQPKWTIKKLKALTKKYTWLKDFRKKEPAAYLYITRHKLKRFGAFFYCVCDQISDALGWYSEFFEM